MFSKKKKRVAEDGDFASIFFVVEKGCPFQIVFKFGRCLFQRRSRDRDFELLE